MKPIDRFYEDQEEPLKSCLWALKGIIEKYHPELEARWYYRLPCFMYRNRIFCYLWVDKKTQFPYIALGKGVALDHPDLIQGNRTFTKILLIDPNHDLPVDKIHSIFDRAMALYPRD